MLLVQLGQGIVQKLLHLVVVNQFLRELPPVGIVFRLRDGFPIVCLFCRFLQRDGVQPLSLADYLEGGVGGDSQKPSGKAGFAPESTQAFEGAQEVCWVTSSAS